MPKQGTSWRTLWLGTGAVAVLAMVLQLAGFRSGCRGICRVDSQSELQRALPESCRAVNPERVVFLRIPKSGTTAMTRRIEAHAPVKGFKVKKFRNWQPGALVIGTLDPSDGTPRIRDYAFEGENVGPAIQRRTCIHGP